MLATAGSPLNPSWCVTDGRQYRTGSQRQRDAAQLRIDHDTDCFPSCWSTTVGPGELRDRAAGWRYRRMTTRLLLSPSIPGADAFGRSSQALTLQSIGDVERLRAIGDLLALRNRPMEERDIHAIVTGGSAVRSADRGLLLRRSRRSATTEDADVLDVAAPAARRPSRPHAPCDRSRSISARHQFRRSGARGSRGAGGSCACRQHLEELTACAKGGTFERAVPSQAEPTLRRRSEIVAATSDRRLAIAGRLLH
jgi:hypothetical protein